MANANRGTPRAHRTAAGLLLLGALALPALAWAETLSWSSLSPEQQATLSDFQPRWDEINETRRAQLVDRAERWRNLPDESRQAILSRWNELKGLSAETRQALRQRWNSLTPDERRQALSAAPASDSTMDTATSN
ncbi:MAG: DUF3106 domain-containing protein [Paraperlucidibaca sp.]